MSGDNSATTGIRFRLLDWWLQPYSLPHRSPHLYCPDHALCKDCYRVLRLQLVIASALHSRSGNTSGNLGMNESEANATVVGLFRPWNAHTNFD